MKSIKTISYTALLAASCAFAGAASAEPSHGIAMAGSLDLPAGFENLPYANPDAPKGGRIVYGEAGTFDALSPFISDGKSPWGMRVHVFEPLMLRSVDESFSLYCLLCETVDMNDERTEIEFTLNTNAKFSDGSPVTTEDVLWSFNTLGTKGKSSYQRYMSQVESLEQTGDHSIKFTMSGENRELPLLLALMPILKKADYEGKEFDVPVTEPTHGSGAYIVDKFEMGKYITFKRNPDYWGKDLPVTRGLYNFDEIKYLYFSDPTTMFEAMKSGDINVFGEGDPKRWESYDFARYEDGEVAKSVIAHSRPTGYIGYVFNTRRAPLDDWQVREALITGFNFPFINKTINDGRYPRITSVYSNSYLGMGDGPAEGRVKELLEPFAGDLPPGALEGYSLPAGNESGRDREGVAHAMEVLAEAGYSVQDGQMKNEAGEPLSVSVLVKGGADEEKYASLWADGLKPLGIELALDTVDAATFEERLRKFDYDIVFTQRQVSLSPGNEQYLYFGSASADEEGSRNYMGAKNPAIDAMIDEMLAAENLDDYVAAVKAIDRAIMAERYIVPIWYNPEFWLLHDAHIKFPENTPKFGYWPGFAPEAFYWEE